MLVNFFAQRVILGKQTFQSVPGALQGEVLKLLQQSGLEALAK